MLTKLSFRHCQLDYPYRSRLCGGLDVVKSARGRDSVAEYVGSGSQGYAVSRAPLVKRLALAQTTRALGQYVGYSLK